MSKLSLLILFFLPLTVFSQVAIKGVVKDPKGIVPFANVILTDTAKAMTGGAISDPSGNFVIKAPVGKYTLNIGYVGYKNWSREITVTGDMDITDILLEPSVKNLNELVVKGRKNLVEYKIDRLVYNVENNIAAAGGNAVNAITTAPGVLLQNGSISILGKGASRVMIDGRMLELTGEELLGYLRSLSANDIKNIEVITNPPAKYEAAGEGGIININLKKGQLNSWKNSTTVTYNQNTYAFYGINNSFLFNRDRFRMALNLSGDKGYSQIRQDLNTGYTSGPWQLMYDGREKRDNAAGRLALDYDVSPSTSVGVQYLGNFNSPGSTDYTLIDIYNNHGSKDSMILNKGVRDINTNSHSFNAHLVSKLDTLNRKLSFDIDYLKFNSEIDNNFVADVFRPDWKYMNTNLSARNISNQRVDNISAKVDMEHPLKFMNLSYGAKVSFINSKPDIAFYNTISGKPVLDPSQSNQFRYKEHNQAVYVSADKDINDKLSIQLGLRVENTNTEGYSVTLNQTNTNNYLKFFPTAYISYDVNKNNSLMLNYGKRINRPGFSLLNPFRSYANSSTYSEGNPFLQPSFSDNIDFTYVYKRKLRTNVFLNIISDGFGTIFSSDPDKKVLAITRQNYYKEYYFGVGEVYSTDVTSWWQTQLTAYMMGSNSSFTYPLDATPSNSVWLLFQTNNTITLGKTTKLQVDYTYLSSRKRGLYAFGDMSGLNVSIQQSFLNNKMQLTLLVNDAFRTFYLHDYTSVVNGIRQVYNENNSSRFFRASLTYRFGNDKVNVKARKLGNEEERERSKD